MNAKKWMWAILALVFLATAFAAGNVFAANTAKISNIYEDDYIVVYADEDFGARIAVNKAGDITSYCPCETGVCPAGELAVVPTATPGAGGGISKAAPTPTATPSSAVGTAPPATQQPSPTSPVVQPSPTNPPPTPVPTVVETKEPEKGVWITHYDGKGEKVWKKCMPVSAKNGHMYHPGHPVQDDIGGACTR